MEISVRDYIKNMFVVESRPTWTAYYEGVILFDQENHVWICGDSIGWIEIQEV